MLQCQIKSAQLFYDFSELPPQYAGDNQLSARIQFAAYFRCFRSEQIAGQIGANNVVPSRASEVAAFEGGQILPTWPNTVLDLVLFGVLSADADRSRVVVERFDGGIAQFGGGDGQDARSGSDVQERLVLAGPAAAGELLQAKEGGVVVAGAEAQSRVQNDHPLPLARAATAPSGLDEEEGADFDRFEMPFPGFGPILARQRFDGDSAPAKIQPAVLEPAQSIAQTGADGLDWSQTLRIYGNDPCACRLVTICGSRLLEMPLQQTRNGLFSLGRGGNGYLPHRAVKAGERRSFSRAWPGPSSRRRSSANLLEKGSVRRIARRPVCR